MLQLRLFVSPHGLLLDAQEIVLGVTEMIVIAPQCASVKNIVAGISANYFSHHTGAWKKL